jgi:hypothetical protein
MAMPTKQSVGLDDEEGLLPDVGAAGQKEQSEAIAVISVISAH